MTQGYKIRNSYANWSYKDRVTGQSVTLWKGTYILKSWIGSDSIPKAMPKVPKGPNYFSIRKCQKTWRRAFPPNPYTMNLTITGPAPAIARKSSGSGISPYAISSQAVNPEHCYVDPSQDYKAIAKLHSLVYGSGFHPGIFLAEMPQALRMIHNTVRRLGLATRWLLQGKLSHALLALGMFSDANLRTLTTAYRQFQLGLKTWGQLWLELQYGWKPLLNDLEAAGRFLAYSLSPDSERMRKVSATRSFEANRRDTPTSGGYGFTEVITKGTIKYTGYGLKPSNDPVVVPLISLAGVIWEKTPWSFVYDWVVPISSYLEALRTTYSITGTFVKTTYLVTDFGDMRLGPGWTSGIIPVSPDSSHSLRRVYLKREIMTQIKPTRPVSATSVPEVFRSLTRTANAVSLFITRAIPDLEVTRHFVKR